MELYYLITISDRDRAEMLSAIYHAAGTGMVLTKLGRGTATGEQLSSYGLDATEKAVVSTVADAEQIRQIFRAAKRKLFIDIPGNGVMMAIPLKSVAGGRTLGFLTDSTQTGGKPAMDFSHELIMAIMNEGYSDTVMDAARSAKRLGAENVYIVYRRGKEELPARAEEVHHAEEEGIEFKLLQNPTKFIGNEDGWVTGMEVIKMELGEPDASGRRRPVPIEGSEEVLDIDTVVVAIGQTPNPLIRKTTKGLDTDNRGCIIADEATGKTSKDHVYAGGDVVTGAATVILAMGAGKAAAEAIDKELNG